MYEEVGVCTEMVKLLSLMACCMPSHNTSSAKEISVSLGPSPTVTTKKKGQAEKYLEKWFLQKQTSMHTK